MCSEVLRGGSQKFLATKRKKKDRQTQLPLQGVGGVCVGLMAMRR